MSIHVNGKTSTDCSGLQTELTVLFVAGKKGFIWWVSLQIYVYNVCL